MQLQKLRKRLTDQWYYDDDEYIPYYTYVCMYAGLQLCTHNRIFFQNPQIFESNINFLIKMVACKLLLAHEKTFYECDESGCDFYFYWVK